MVKLVHMGTATSFNGSCWAFGAIGAIEGINFIRTGKLVKLSEQQLLDCNNWTNFGCCAGSVQSALHYVRLNKGIALSSSYPYRGFQQIAKKMECKLVTIDGYWMLAPNSERDLKRAVASQPVAVMLKTDSAFMNYDGGVLYSQPYQAHELNHFALVVGYGETEEGEKYWVVKNSWGPSYGLGGYVLIARDFCEGGSLGIARVPVFPLKKSKNRTGWVCTEKDLMHPVAMYQPGVYATPNIHLADTTIEDDIGFAQRK